MPLPHNAAPLLAQALDKLLGQPTPGAMAFLRCLTADAVATLATDPRFAVPGWRCAVVGGGNDAAAHTISADTAVEWREDKAEPALLLVDTEAAGAGMDGIYSAAREIDETELFDCAQELARAKLQHGFKGFAQKAIACARRLARHHALTPWREFLYLCRASQSIEACGGALPEIGLWPVALSGKPDDADLDLSARLVDRLLPLRGAAQIPEARVEALKLPDDQPEVALHLAHFLREADRLPRFEALACLEDSEEL